MSERRVVCLDRGRLQVHRPFLAVLEHSGLTCVESWLAYEGGEVAKHAVAERRTDRVSLPDGAGGRFEGFLKRHQPAPWREHLKAWLRLTTPTLGARVEWEALWEFEEAGVPTMTPVAFGESGGRSFVLTESLEPGRKLSELCQDPLLPPRRRQRLVREVAGLARRMHEAGLHHQDFYVGHLICRIDQPGHPVHVLDLGRARRQRSLVGRSVLRSGLRCQLRWIIKDLAQLDYSADGLTASDRLRFLYEYLGRRPDKDDRRLLARVERKSRAIARHSRKNRL